MALANHGGGYLIIGLQPQNGQSTSVEPEEKTLSEHWTPDAVNAIVKKFAEPGFHCSVRMVPHPVTKVVHPIIGVPAGTVPIRCKSDFENIVREHTYYIRRPGPESGQPLTATEWEQFINRCIRVGRGSLLSAFREIMDGTASTNPSKDLGERLDEWLATSVASHKAILDENDCPPDDPTRMPLGRFEFASIFTEETDEEGFGELRRHLEQASRTAHSGWPPFVHLHHVDHRPALRDNAIQAWLGRNEAIRDPAHSDYWRAGPSGELYLTRGFQEDAWNGVTPGSTIDWRVPIFRVGECLAFLQQFAAFQDRLASDALIQVKYTGLRNRICAPLGNSYILGRAGRAASQEDTYTKRLIITPAKISDNLPELVRAILADLYLLFGFYEPPRALYNNTLEPITRGPS